MPPTTEHNHQHSKDYDEMVGDLINLANTILAASQSRETVMNNLVTSVAVVDQRVKFLEKIIWPVVIAAITAMVGAFFTLLTK